MPAASATDVATRLLAWYDACRRDLPWRRTRDPWAVWVSEVMLQQTRVEAVRAAYERFLQRYPAPADFARADDDEVHAAWRGLGYYRRARLLRDGARAVCERHGGTLPADAASLGRLPGIGAYTAGALGSIVFDRAEPAIDGNVERVVARHRGVGEPADAAAGRHAIRRHAAAWIDAARPGDFNQALMELGALVCTPARPACGRCPIAGDCVARRQQRTGELPVRKARPAPRAVLARVVLCAVPGGAVLGHRVAAGEPNAGQVELPGPGVLRAIDAADLAAALRERFDARVVVGEELGAVTHAITNHRLRVVAHAAVVRRRGRLEPFAPGDERTPWTTVSRKLFAAVAGDAPPNVTRTADGGKTGRSDSST